MGTSIARQLTMIAWVTYLELPGAAKGHMISSILKVLYSSCKKA
jgi:hypothetical protein